MSGLPQLATKLRASAEVYFVPEGKAATRMLQTEDGRPSYWTSTILGPVDSICTLGEGRYDGNAGSGDRKAASGGAP